MLCKLGVHVLKDMCLPRKIRCILEPVIFDCRREGNQLNKPLALLKDRLLTSDELDKETIGHQVSKPLIYGSNAAEGAFPFSRF